MQADVPVQVLLMSSCSYRLRLEAFVKLDHRSVHSVVKAHLVCEQQLR